MNESKISVRYAKALFELAKEKKAIDQVREDMVAIGEVMALGEMRDLIMSPVIENRVKQKSLLAILEKKIGELAMNLVILTVNNNRESFLPGIARCFIDFADKHNGITKAVLTTATGVSDEVADRIKELIEKTYNSRVLMKINSDPDITGGFMLKIEDRFLDASIKSQLRQIEMELTGN